MIRSRSSQVLYKKIYFEKHCFSDLKICNFTKKILLHRCFLGILWNFTVKDFCWSLFLVCKIHRKALVGESLFNTVSDLDLTTLLKKKLRHECSPVGFEIFFRINILAEQTDRRVLRLDRRVLRVDRRVLHVDRQVLRWVTRRLRCVDKRVLQVDKRILQVGEECYEWPGKSYHNIMNTTLNIYLFLLTLRCVKLMKKLITFSVNWYVCLSN